MGCKVIANLDDETREKLDFICKRDKRAMSNMMVFLIDYYYKQVTEEKETKKDKNYDVYEELLKLEGIGWEGDLEESRS